MAGFLFRKVVFGPVRSRRFGLSLGINLLPLNIKACSFDCIYCECGFTERQYSGANFYPPDYIRQQMELQFAELEASHIYPDSLTFAGNGEPCLHPDFHLIVDDVAGLRKRFFPNAKITVLSNASLLDNESIRQALLRVDNNVLKLDAGDSATFFQINRPMPGVDFDIIVENLKLLKNNLTIQSLFLRGVFNGVQVDNTAAENIEAWLKLIADIRPQKVMVYSIDRATPNRGLEKLSYGELESIAVKVKALGIQAEVY